MKKLILAITLLSSPVLAGEIHSDHWRYGLPGGLSEENDLVIRRPYALSNNGTTKFADWVAYKLTPYDVWGQVDLYRKWRTDPYLGEDETLEATGSGKDYTGAHSLDIQYEKGHLAPLASFKGSPYASDLNYFSNIVPQSKALNGGPWRELEAAIRDYVKKGNVVWVQTGPLYEAAMPALPNADEPHEIPSHFWKVVLTEDDQVAAFIMSQIPAEGASLASFAVTLDEVEARSGLNLNPTIGETGESSIAVNWLLD